MYTVANSMIDVFKYLQANHQSEIETIRKQYASEPFMFTEEPLVIK